MTTRARAKKLPARHKPAPPKRGRPSLGDHGLSRVISLKISNDLYPRYVARAGELEMSVGAWLRKLADDDMAGWPASIADPGGRGRTGERA